MSSNEVRHTAAKKNMQRKKGIFKKHADKNRNCMRRYFGINSERKKSFALRFSQRFALKLKCVAY